MEPDNFFLLYYVMFYYIRLYYIIFCYIMCYFIYLPPRWALEVPELQGGYRFSGA